MEIIQLAETKIQEKKKGKKKKGGNDDHDDYNFDYSPICRGIENKLSVNKSLRVLEIRYIVLNRSFVNAVFAGISTNSTLQVLTLTHNSLLDAIYEDYETLGDSLRKNEGLLSIDFSYNEPLDDELSYHKAITDMILESGETT